MGALIGLALAKYAPERFTAMILGGSHPYPLHMQTPIQMTEAPLTIT